MVCGAAKIRMGRLKAGRQLRSERAALLSQTRLLRFPHSTALCAAANKKGRSVKRHAPRILTVFLVMKINPCHAAEGHEEWVCACAGRSFAAIVCIAVLRQTRCNRKKPTAYSRSPVFCTAAVLIRRARIHSQQNLL